MSQKEKQRSWGEVCCRVVCWTGVGWVLVGGGGRKRGNQLAHMMDATRGPQTRADSHSLHHPSIHPSIPLARYINSTVGLQALQDENNLH